MNKIFSLSNTISGNFGWAFAKLADLNGDGILDIIGTRLYWPPQDLGIPVEILLGDGKGGFTRADLVSGALPAPVHPREIIVADFNGDGRADVFIADHGYDAEPFPGNKNWLLLSTADGKLVSAPLPFSSDFTHSAAAADIDGDGDIDLFVGNIFRGDPHFLINDGTGGFAKSTVGLPSEITNTGMGTKFTTSVFADLNGDGHPDLVLGADQGTRHAVLINDGSGNFSIAQRMDGIFGPVDTITVDVRVADFNGDGRPDILFNSTQREPFYVGSGLQLFVQDAAGGFQDASGGIPSNPKLDGPWNVWANAVDIDGNGTVDILIDPQFPARANVLLNQGDGTFSSLVYDGPFRRFEFGDINGDGAIDAIAFGGGKLEVFLNVTGPRNFKTDRGDNVFVGSLLDDAVRGTEGFDYFVVNANRNDAVLHMQGRHISIFSSQGFDTLVDVEGIIFNDVTLIRTLDDDDIIFAPDGSNHIDAGSGLDTVVYSFASNQAVIEDKEDGSVVVTKQQGGVDVLTNVEIIQFSNGNLFKPSATVDLIDRAVYRFFNQDGGSHFYTANHPEAQQIATSVPGFRYEGVAYLTANKESSDSNTFFRFFNTETGTHFFTSSEVERDSVSSSLPQYKYEGIAFNIYDSGGTGKQALHRFFNTETGVHFYTASEAERDNIVQTLSQFSYEGITGYVDVA